MCSDEKQKSCPDFFLPVLGRKCFICCVCANICMHSTMCLPKALFLCAQLVTGKLNPSLQKGVATMHSVVRSKGFVWVSSQWQNALYWSHAGAHFEMQPLGMWWAATARSKWPDAGDQNSDEVHKILEEFDVEGGVHGDRRQELVFIGVGMDQAQIEGLLDACLLTDTELEAVKQKFSSSLPADPVCVKLADSGQRLLVEKA